MQGYGWLSEWRKHVQQPISEELGKVLDKLLQINPADRYQTATEVLLDLEQAQSQTAAEKVQRYQAEFSKAVGSVYPLDEDVREGLKQLQQSLGLQDADVARIEQPILKQAEAERQEQIKQQVEANQQEQLRQQEKAHQQTPLPPTSAPQPSTPPPLTLVPQKKNRRQFLTLAAFGGVGLGSVLVWEAIKNTQRDSTHSGSTLDLKNFEFEVVSVDKTGAISNRSQKKAQFFAEELNSVTTLEMVEIPGGIFTMGSPFNELERLDGEGPQHEVTVPTFYLGKYQVTQAQWVAIMGANPSNFKGANRPVELVSWNEAVEFCQKLSQKSGKDYRLPSEAEWEYACRAETETPFHFGETITSKLANYKSTYTYGSGPKGEYRRQTTDVGSFPPNAFGLYDMSGNVWEWCQDNGHYNYEGAPTDGRAWTNNNDSRILRGGSWIEPPSSCRSACRVRDTPGGRSDGIGFRLALSAPRTLQ